MKMGDKVRDTITGYEGTLIGITDFMYGCRRLGVMRGDKDGKPETEWFDEPQLELVKQEAVPEPLRRTGGPRDAAQRRPDVS